MACIMTGGLFSSLFTCTASRSVEIIGVRMIGSLQLKEKTFSVQSIRKMQDTENIS